MYFPISRISTCAIRNESVDSAPLVFVHAFRMQSIAATARAGVV